MPCLPVWLGKQQVCFPNRMGSGTPFASRERSSEAFLIQYRDKGFAGFRPILCSGGLGEWSSRFQAAYPIIEVGTVLTHRGYADLLGGDCALDHFTI